MNYDFYVNKNLESRVTFRELVTFCSPFCSIAAALLDPISYNEKKKSARLTGNRTCGAAIKIQKTQQSLPHHGAARQGEKNKIAEFIDHGM